MISVRAPVAPLRSGSTLSLDVNRLNRAGALAADRTTCWRWHVAGDEPQA